MSHRTIVGLAGYAAGRIAFLAALVVVATVGAVLLARLAPGGADAELFGTDASVQTRAAALADDVRARSAREVGLEWLHRLVTLDFGLSQKYRRPVISLVAERALRTAALVAIAFTLALVIGVGVATSVTGRHGPWPRVVRTASVALQSCPALLVALVLTWLAWRSGWQAAALRASGLSGFLLTIAVPVLSLALPLAAVLERMHARVFAGVLRGPIIEALRARGIHDSAVRWRHALRLAAPPLVGIASALGGALLGGSLAVELVTAWPGLGRLAYDAFAARDTPLMAGCAAAAAAFVGVATAVGDVVIAAIDPRGDSARPGGGAS